MQRTRFFSRIALAASCGLLICTTSAYAECAWVLWGQYTRDSDLQEAYVLSEAFEGKTPCDEAADKKNAREDMAWKGGVRTRPYAKGAASDVFWRCYPGTLDPRGPKGK